MLFLKIYNIECIAFSDYKEKKELCRDASGHWRALQDFEPSCSSPQSFMLCIAGALDEVDWLRTKLESLETSIAVMAQNAGSPVPADRQPAGPDSGQRYVCLALLAACLPAAVHPCLAVALLACSICLLDGLQAPADLPQAYVWPPISQQQQLRVSPCQATPDQKCKPVMLQ